MSETWGQWYQGVDNSGDITLWENVEGLIEVVRRELGEVYLVRRGRGREKRKRSKERGMDGRREGVSE